MYIYSKCQQHIKKLKSLLKLLISYISGRSAPKKLSLKDRNTFCFLIIGLCNSSAICWF